MKIDQQKELFKAINDTDKIWIYQADRFLTEEEVIGISELANNFTQQWTAHDNQLSAKAFVFHNLFLVLAVNESMNIASGCSIDKSVAFIKNLNYEFKIDFLQRNLVASVENEKINIIPLDRLTDQIQSLEQALVFNNLLTNGQELKTKWLVPILLSWHQRFIEIEI